MAYRHKGRLQKLVIHDLERIQARINRIKKGIDRKYYGKKLTVAIGTRNQRLFAIMRNGLYTAKTKALGIAESGHLESSIKLSYKRDSENRIISAKLHLTGWGAKYGRFVEFGTGIVGEEHSYLIPGVDTWWDYGGEDSEGTWVFRSKTRAHNSGGKKKNNYYTTSGQPPRAFMYAAYLKIKELINMGQDSSKVVGKYSEQMKMNKKWFKVTYGIKDKNPVVLVTVIGTEKMPPISKEDKPKMRKK